MAESKARALLRMQFEEAAKEYAYRQRSDLFSDPVALANQRKNTLASFDALRGHRPDIQVFSELALHSRHGRSLLQQQVVPDITVILCDTPIEAEECYNLSVQPGRVIWVMDHVLRRNNRKDYDDNLRKYEQELKVPYYLRFAPDSREMKLSRHNGRRYVPVAANSRGRMAVSELDLEVGLLDGWMRYWFRDELVPLIGELQQQLAHARWQLEEAVSRADELRQRVETLERELAQAKSPPTQPDRPTKKNSRH